MLAAVAVVLGVSVSNWPMYRITDCELGLSMSPARCEQPLLDYFGVPLLFVLAIPVALFLLSAVVGRMWMAWTATGTMVVLTAVGFYSAGGSTPSLVSTLGSLPATALALLLTIAQLMVTSAGVHLRQFAGTRQRSIR